MSTWSADRVRGLQIPMIRCQLSDFALRSVRPLAYPGPAAVAIVLIASLCAGVDVAPAQETAIPQGVQLPALLASNEGHLQEITVNANRRAESNQYVPAAITAIPALTVDRLGIDDVTSLAALVPGLNFNRQANSSIPFLRGVGTPVGQSGDEPSVALYVDDVYLPAGSASIGNFNGIERIEVEKGPQGTLFGRNATGGVVQVFTRDPTPDPVLEVRAGLGNYDTLSADTYATGRLAEHLLANMSAYWSNQSGGWGRNVSTGLPTFKFRDYGGRVKLLWSGIERASALLTLDFDKTIAQQGVGFVAWPGTNSLDPLPPLPNGGFSSPPGYYDTRENLQSNGNNRQFGASLKLTANLEALRIVSISAYRDIRSDYLLDQDLGPLPVVNALATTKETTFTQELQFLSSRQSRSSWIGGLYYYNDKAGYEPLHLSGDAFVPLPYVDAFGIEPTQSWAVFAQGTTTLLDRTHLTAGARYTEDHRTIRAGAVYGGTSFIPAANSPRQKTWSSPTWRLIVDHRFTPDLMAYVGYNRGFKSGQFNTVVLPSAPLDEPVNPEKVDAFTAGFKSEFLRRRLRLNLEAFHYDYRNIQVDQILQGVTHITNAAKATIKGVDLDVTTMPFDTLTLTASFEGLQGRYDSFPDGTFYVYGNATGGNCAFLVAPSPAAVPCGGAARPPNYDAATGHWDLRGNHTIQTPPFSASLVAQYEFPTAIGPIDLNFSWTHTGNYFISPDNGRGQVAPSSSKNTMQPLVNILNASLGWKWATSGLEVRLWAKNISGVEYWSEADLQAFATQYSPAPPRTYGFTVRMRIE